VTGEGIAELKTRISELFAGRFQAVTFYVLAYGSLNVLAFAALHLASASGDLDTVQQLCTHFDFSDIVRTAGGSDTPSCFETAAINGHVDVVKWLPERDEPPPGVVPGGGAFRLG